MVKEVWVIFDSGNGLLPGGTKPLPEPMLTDHQWSPVTCILGKFYEILYPSITKSCLKVTYLKFHSNFPRVNELKKLNHSFKSWSLTIYLIISRRPSKAIFDDIKEMVGPTPSIKITVITLCYNNQQFTEFFDYQETRNLCWLVC